MALNQTAASIPALLLQRTATQGSATILRKKNRGIWKSVSWAELGTHVRHAGMALKAAGFRPGDVVGVLAETRLEWVTADLGILSAGCVSLGIPPEQSTDGVADILRDTGCRALFVENEEQLDKALNARTRCPALQRIIIFDMIGLREFADPACESFTDFLARGIAADDADKQAWEAGIAAIADQHPAMLPLGASGSAGTGRVLTHGDVLQRLATARGQLEPRSGDERLALLPMSDPMERIFGLYYALDTGTVSNYLENTETALENLQEVQPTALGADAATWGRLHARITQQAAAATPVQRQLYLWAIAAGRRGGAAAWIARALVLGQVRRELGLARLQLAYVGGPPLSPDVAAWVAALGIRIIRLDGDTARASATGQRYGAQIVEA